MPGFTLDRSALHLAIDMQRLFAEQTEWFMPWLERVLPNVAAIARHAPQRTLFTRFIPPRVPEQMPGAWQDYYRHWRAMTRERLDPRLLDLAGPLAGLCPPGHVIDKTVYSAFGGTRLAPFLRSKGIGTLIVTGAKPTSACWRPSWRRSTLGFASSCRPMRCAARAIAPTMP